MSRTIQHTTRASGEVGNNLHDRARGSTVAGRWTSGAKEVRSKGCSPFGRRRLARRVRIFYWSTVPWTAKGQKGGQRSGYDARLDQCDFHIGRRMGARSCAASRLPALFSVPSSCVCSRVGTTLQARTLSSSPFKLASNLAENYQTETVSLGP